LAAAGATKVNSGAGEQFDSSLMAYEVAANGGGIALGRTSMSAKEIKSGRLVRPFVLSVPVQEAFFVLTPEEGLNHPDATIFKDWLVAKAEQDRQDPS
jgi:LysR family glycine cleavage system transcriptional activator